MAAVAQATTSSRPWLPVAALVILTIIWGVTWVIAKQGLAYAPPFAFAADRAFCAALALLILLKISGRPMQLMAPGLTIVISLLQVTASLSLQTWALTSGGAGKTAVLVFTMPLWTLLLSWPILGERIRGGQWLAAFSTLGGLLLIIEPWAIHDGLFGNFLGVLAALCWAVGTLLIKRYRSRLNADVLVFTTWQIVLGSLPLLFLSAIIPERTTDWSLAYIGILVFIALVSFSFCWLLWLYVLDRLPAWEAGLSLLGTPVVALVSSRLVLGEAFKPTETAGILLISTGLALLSLIGWYSSRRA